MTFKGIISKDTACELAATDAMMLDLQDEIFWQKKETVSFQFFIAFVVRTNCDF